MAVSSVSKLRRQEGFAAVVGAISPGALVLAAAVPVLFLHRRWQPTLTISIASVHPQAMLSDFAVALIVVAALASGARGGFAPLRAGRLAWLAGVALSVWIAISIAYATAHFGPYPWRTHGVTAAKWFEYALLAPALPLLLRRRRDLDVLLWSLALWSVAATVVGLLQFFGANVAAAGTFGHRQASFLGSGDYAALSGATVLAGAVFPRSWLARILVVAGGLGTIIAGSLAGMAGVAAAVLALAAMSYRKDRRRSVALVGVVALVAAGSLLIRTADLSSFQRFVGGKSGHESNPGKVETYAQHTLLLYVGGRIWLGHPLLGVGWQGSNDPYAFEPYIPAAKRRFDNVSPASFPAPGRTYGVQNSYVQALADLGIPGFAALLGLLGAALVLATGIRSKQHAVTRDAAGLIGGSWVVLVAFLWLAQGLIAGVPLDALLWLAIGLSATAAAWRGTDA